jgi:hypothetical protein
VATNRLLNSVIEAKHTLSVRKATSVRIDYRGLFGEFPVSRELFQDLTADLLERTAYTTRQLIADARLQWPEVSRVLLVGGSTRMPMVGEMLRAMTGVEPDRSVNPDEAVARGAAIYAGYLLSQQRGQKAAFEVTNVNSHSLGIEGIDQATLRKTNVVLIPRNTPLPAKKTERFITKSGNQRSIVIQVLEGESSLPGECTAIGRTVVRDLPFGLPQGWPIEVTFEFGTNGRLAVHAAVPGTQQEALLDLERSAGLSNAGIARWKQPVESAAGFDAFEAMVHEALGNPAGGLPVYPGSAVSAPMGPGAAPPTAAGLPPVPPASPPPPAATMLLPPPPPPAMSSPTSPPAVPGAIPLPLGLAGGGGASLSLPPTTAPLPLAPAEAVPAAMPATSARRSARPPRWIVGLVGYLTSALAGLGLGYLVLHWLRPNTFPWLW